MEVAVRAFHGNILQFQSNSLGRPLQCRCVSLADVRRETTNQFQRAHYVGPKREPPNLFGSRVEIQETSMSSASPKKWSAPGSYGIVLPHSALPEADLQMVTVAVD